MTGAVMTKTGATSTLSSADAASIKSRCNAGGVVCFGTGTIPSALRNLPTYSLASIKIPLDDVARGRGIPCGKSQGIKEVGMSKLSLWKTICLVCVFCAVAAIGSPAQTFTLLHSFNGTDGSAPYAVVQGTNGNFYGAASGGGAYANGTVFKITHGGTLTTLHSFCAQAGCPDGSAPNGLVLATDGNFYGTTASGASTSCTGLSGCGTVFKITHGGTLTTLHSFNGNDGAEPAATLVEATDANLYGATNYGGANCAPYGCGTVFKITPSGKLTTLHSFDGTDGSNPWGVVQATDGNFYGTTSLGGANGQGTVFKIAQTGTLTTVYSFCSQTGCTDGSYASEGLVQATDGNFYGTTWFGGANNDGTVFKITARGTLTTLHSFNGTDGFTPRGGVVQGADGNFYGSVDNGHPSNDGAVFKITATGRLTTLHSFRGTDGRFPFAAPVQATDGNFYGTTAGGGTSSNCPFVGCGTVFSLSVGLSPFIETLPTSGKVGTAVTILGNNLTDSTGVAFNGTAATFKVISSTEIKTKVPDGATTGFVKVTRPKRTLKSNVAFRVKK